MRGTGYAIGEILIFLAIATIIGFLLGWLVFYRRPGTSSKLSPSNPNHVRQLETRAKAVEAKMGNLEKKATALLATLSKAPRTPTPTKAETMAPAAVAKADEAKKDVAQKADTAKEAVAAQTDEVKKDVAHKADTAKEAVAAKADEAQKAVEKTADRAKTGAGATEAPADEIDGYLSEADDRISKLEETLDKLSEKLAELEGD